MDKTGVKYAIFNYIGGKCVLVPIVWLFGLKVSHDVYMMLV